MIPPEYMNQIVTGDARELARRIPDGSVDLVLTDPPFGVRSEEWDDMDAQELARFTMGWLSDARRVSPRLVTFFSAKYLQLIQDLCALLYPETRVMIWNKPMGSQYAGSSHNGFWYAYEVILYCHQGYDKPKGLLVGSLIKEARERKGLSRGGVDMVLRGKKTGLCFRWEEAACLPTLAQGVQLCDLLGLGSDFIDTLRAAYSTTAKAAKRDVFDYRTVINSNHPCSKPEGLIRELLDNLTDVGDVVYDPFTGGGTVPVVCKMLGRNFIASEIDPDTAQKARERLAMTQVPLFVLSEEQATMEVGA